MRSLALISALPLLSASLTFASHHAGVKIIPLKAPQKNFADRDGVVDLDVLEEYVESRITARFPSTGESLRKRGAKGTVKFGHVGRGVWQGQISAGTPPTTFTVLIDSGSEHFYLPSSECRNCQQKNSYNPSSSSSSSALNRDFTFAFGDGSTIRGDLYTDVVTVGGISVNQTFGVATDFESPLPALADGLIGLAVTSTTEFNTKPFFHNLIQSGNLEQPVFAVKFSRSGDSELTVGGVNPALYRGEIRKVPVYDQVHWQVTMDSVNYNGRPVVSSQFAIIDTGTSFIIGDDASVEQLYNSIPNATPEYNFLGNARGFYSYPCRETPNVSLTFGGKSFTIDRSLFAIGRTKTGRCVGTIASGYGLSDSWIIGNQFLQNVYTVFDMGGNGSRPTVGFADLANVFHPN